MGDSAELAARDQLQGLARLECEAVLGNVDFDDVVGARADIEARVRVRGGREFGEGESHLRSCGRGRGWMGGLIDEHGRGKSRQTSQIDVGSAPVIVHRLRGFFCWVLFSGRRLWWWEVMQQAGFCREARLDNMLEKSILVPVNIGQGVPVTGSGDESGSVDD